MSESLEELRPRAFGSPARELARQASRIGGVTVRPTEVNGQPGAMFLDPDGKLISVMGLDIAAGRIQAVRSIVNPDKLQHLGPVADLGALLRGAG